MAAQIRTFFLLEAGKRGRIDIISFSTGRCSREVRPTSGRAGRDRSDHHHEKVTALSGKGMARTGLKSCRFFRYGFKAGIIRRSLPCAPVCLGRSCQRYSRLCVRGVALVNSCERTTLYPGVLTWGPGWVVPLHPRGTAPPTHGYIPTSPACCSGHAFLAPSGQGAFAVPFRLAERAARLVPSSFTA